MIMIMILDRKYSCDCLLFLSLQDKEMLVDGVEVAVVYFRMGYVPSHFHGPEDWATRLLIERSRAIKSPSVYYLLAGTKKVQQVRLMRHKKGCSCEKREGLGIQKHRDFDFGPSIGNLNSSPCRCTVKNSDTGLDFPLPIGLENVS